MQLFKKRLITVKTINLIIWGLAAALCCYLVFSFGENVGDWI